MMYNENSQHLHHASVPPAQAASEQSPQCTILHPEHRFLAFDDLLTPTRMTIYLTSQRFESDLEDKRRRRVAQEIQWTCKERGIDLQVTVEREKDAPGVTGGITRSEHGTGQPPSEKTEE